MRLFYVFMEGFHLPHGKASFQDDRTFHHKVISKLYGNSNLSFLVNLILILSTLI